ncbi:MAG TPA: phytanoyl-CoA dioxygenase family protein [Acidimicrobiales bacterium]|nr:phytanoyl-CoA dioxygenase family protein [Acidimicrobiales bacterium]
MAMVAHALTPHQRRSWDAVGYAVVPGATSSARLLDLAAEVLGGPAELVATTVDVRAPGQRGTGWHHVGDGGRGVTAWVAFTPADLVAGCVWVVPGSHRDPPPAGVGGAAASTVAPDPATTRPLPLRAGDLLLLHDRLVRRVTDNHSVTPSAVRVSRFLPAG